MKLYKNKKNQASKPDNKQSKVRLLMKGGDKLTTQPSTSTEDSNTETDLSKISKSWSEVMTDESKDSVDQKEKNPKMKEEAKAEIASNSPKDNEAAENPLHCLLGNVAMTKRIE